MPEEEELIPVFIPTLAEMLAHAEKTKGTPLTETEVLRIRDNAACIMMRPEHAEQMVGPRGFRDVEPENCWADWHRLRVQLTGNGYLPKIVLCAVGDDNLTTSFSPILKAEKLEHEWKEHDERMVGAFEASACRFDPSLEQNDLESIAAHAKVLYVLSKNFTAAEAPSTSRSFLRLVGELLKVGAAAVKCESAGITHGRQRWLELADEAKKDDCWPALFRAYVQLPIQDGDDYYTCGMHLLGKPDLIVSDRLLRKAFRSTKAKPHEAINLFRAFALYLLMECKEGQFGSGHTFSVDAESPHFRVLWEQCTGYDEDEFVFNPFGRWRFAEIAT
jgi:hypothetical protein